MPVRRLNFDGSVTELQRIVRIQPYPGFAPAVYHDALWAQRGQQQAATREAAQHGVLWINIFVGNLHVLIGSAPDRQLRSLKYSTGRWPVGGRGTSGYLAYEADQHRLTSTERQ